MSISTNKIFRAENWHQTLQICDILISRQPQEIHAPWQQAETCTPELRLETGQCIILMVKYSWLNSKFPLYLHFFLNRIVAGYEIYCRLQPGHFITLRCALRHAAVASQHKAGHLATCGGHNMKIFYFWTSWGLHVDSIVTLLVCWIIYQDLNLCSLLWVTKVKIVPSGQLWAPDESVGTCVCLPDTCQLPLWTVNGPIQDIFPQSFLILIFFLRLLWFVLETLT